MPSAFAPIPDGSVTSPGGFTAAAAHAGLKSDGALDPHAGTRAPRLDAARAMPRRAEEAAGLPPRTAPVLSPRGIGLAQPILDFVARQGHAADTRREHERRARWQAGCLFGTSRMG